MKYDVITSKDVRVKPGLGNADKRGGSNILVPSEWQEHKPDGLVGPTVSDCRGGKIKERCKMK